MLNNPLGGADPDGHNAFTDWVANAWSNTTAAVGSFFDGRQTSVATTQGDGTAITPAEANALQLENTAVSITMVGMVGGETAPIEQEATAITDEALASRANTIQNAQDSFGQTKSTTAAASVTDANGNSSILVGSSRNALTPSQRAALQPGETAVTGSGHAETTVINAAQSQGMTVNSVAASRPICANCAQAIKDAGAQAASPVKQPE